jgi:hypothetical protein
MLKSLFLQVIFPSILLFSEENEGFIKVKGKNLADKNGKIFFIKGINLGNWLLPEGYMWLLSSSYYDRPRRIEKLIIDLIGTDKAREFWKKYRDNYITEEDIKEIKNIGFNTVRVPINYRLFLEENSTNLIEEGFIYLDRLVDWCRKYNLFLVIDLHAAPGGQTGDNIDDSEANSTDLFKNEFYEEMTVFLWKNIALRYKDEKNVLAYDLLNEPLPKRENNVHLYYKLEILYKKITKAIRGVDTNHIITIEGANWATDFSIFSEPFDSNILYQFHKYWDNTDDASLEKYLYFREKYNVPVWCGETGENNNQWYYNNFRLLEKHNIDWAFWPWKKLYNPNCPYSIKYPDGWGKVTSYARYGTKLEREEAERILSNFIENILIKNCEFNEEVIKAIFGRK